KSNSRAVSIKLQSGYRRGILGTDHDDVRIVVRVRLFVVVHHLGQILAWNTKVVREIVIAGGDDEFASPVSLHVIDTIARRHLEVPVGARYLLNSLILANLQPIVRSNLAVVLKRLRSRRLLISGSGKRYIADFQQLRRREERHVGGIVKQRIDDATLVDV